MAQAETVEPKVSTLKLDEETRNRIANELQLMGGASAIPEEIALIAVDPKEAGHEEGEVAGFSTLGQALSTHNVFLNSALTPRLSSDSLYSSGLARRNRLNIALVI